MPKPPRSEYARGAAYGLAAVSIWAGNIVVAGLGLRSNLTPWDISAIRFCVACRTWREPALRFIAWVGSAWRHWCLAARRRCCSRISACCSHRPRTQVLFPGVMPLMVAILASVLLNEPFTTPKKVGFALIVSGVIGIVWSAGGSLGTRQNIGHLLFLGSALAWACYTVAMRRAGLSGLHAAAISAVGSLLIYVPPYAVIAGAGLFEASFGAIALQAVVQGVLTAVISYLLYGSAVGILGASSGAAFAALCPAMTALMAIPVLGEWPAAIDWVAIVVISAGVYVVSGGPLPIRRRA